MAKVGYIFAAACYDGVDADKEWMCRYGCVQVVQEKSEHEKTIVSMYNSSHSIDDIWSVSGFHSRSSVFRILNKYGVTLNRGKFSGPLGKRKKDE